MRTTYLRGARDAFTVQPAYKQARAARALGGALNDYTCGGETAMDAWLADARVTRALHVRDDRSGGSYQSDAKDHFELYTKYKAEQRRRREAEDRCGAVTRAFYRYTQAVHGCPWHWALGTRHLNQEDQGRQGPAAPGQACFE